MIFIAIYSLTLLFDYVSISPGDSHFINLIISSPPTVSEVFINNNSASASFCGKHLQFYFLHLIYFYSRHFAMEVITKLSMHTFESSPENSTKTLMEYFIPSFYQIMIHRLQYHFNHFSNGFMSSTFLRSVDQTSHSK